MIPWLIAVALAAEPLVVTVDLEVNGDRYDALTWEVLREGPLPPRDTALDDGSALRIRPQILGIRGGEVLVEIDVSRHRRGRHQDVSRPTIQVLHGSRAAITIGRLHPAAKVGWVRGADTGLSAGVRVTGPVPAAVTDARDLVRRVPSGEEVTTAWLAPAPWLDPTTPILCASGTTVLRGLNHLVFTVEGPAPVDALRTTWCELGSGDTALDRVRLELRTESRTSRG